MAARTDKLNRNGQFTSENAAENAKKAHVSREMNRAKEKLIAERVLELLTPEDIDEISHGVIEGAKQGKKDALEMFLKLIGQYPDAKQTIDVRMQGITDADRSLMQSVKDLYDTV